MIPALIVCHGKLGDAYLEALAGIYGETTGISALSNDGLSAAVLHAAVAERMAALGETGLVFTDYFGGSCATACLALLGGRPGLHLISGVNLPILLYYLAHRHELSAPALVRGIVHRGQNAIRELTPPSL
jgi:PTS system mannose-specific IIA component/fructoselysine and glucoselysine-specific PTS system IIA component